MTKRRDKTTSVIAYKLGYTEYWVRKLARENKIPGNKKGKSWLFNYDEVFDAIFTPNSYKKS